MKSPLLTFFADIIFAFFVLAATVIILRLKKRRGEVIIRGVIAGLLALIIDKSSGLVYFHERPFVQQGLEAGALNPHNNSFPSDHSLIVFTAALVVWAATRNWKLGLPLVIGGIIVGWARVVALVHYPVDIVGSFVIAGVMVGLWFWLPLPKGVQHFAKALDKTLDKKLPRWLTKRR